jgi:hypothetical protein
MIYLLPQAGNANRWADCPKEKIMQCQIIWGMDEPKRCENTAQDWMLVRLANGDSKTISICRKCQSKIYSKEYAAQHRLHMDAGDSPAPQALSQPVILSPRRSLFSPTASNTNR